MLPKVATAKQRLFYEYGLKHPYSTFSVDPRLGKAQPIDSVVYCPDGPKKIGDLRVGSTVLGMDGRPKKVTGVFPQGIKEVFRSHFSDGSSTLSCGNHLWSVKSGNDRARGKPYRVMATREIKSLLERGMKDERWFIPMSAPAGFNSRDTVIPPYSLGVLIGDGGLKAGVTFTNRSEHIFNKVREQAEDQGLIVTRTTRDSGNTKIVIKTPMGEANPWWNEIKRLGLNVLSKNKRVPDEYKINSVESRIELLRGLLDTDGYIASDGTMQFTSASEGLCDDVEWLVQSLGGVARKNYKLSKCQTGEFDSWTLTVSLPEDIVPVTKPFKLKRYRPKIRYQPSRKFLSISPEGKSECVCISVDGEHYLTDEFIVTHNTLVSISIQQKLNNNCLVICPSYLVLNWKKEVNKWAPKAQVTVFQKGSQIYEPCDSDFVVISYDLVQKAEHLFSWCDMVVLDEAHSIKSLSAKRTQFIHRCIYENSIKRVHPMTGTVIKNRVSEFYSIISLMNYDPRDPDPPFLRKYPDEITFSDQFSYRKTFDVEVKTKRGQRFKMPVIRWEGLRNKEELKKWLKGKYIRIKADENDLPPVVEKSILVSESPNKALLAAFEAHFSAEGSGSVRPDIKREAAVQKVPFTIRYVEGLLEVSECVLVYSDHVASIEAIARHFGVEAITGKMPAAKRSRLADEFQSGEGKVLCATIGALKEGRDLFRSKDIVFNDICWVPGDMKQVINRIRGMGQKDPRTAHYILGSPQDSKILEALQSKVSVIEAATD